MKKRRRAIERKYNRYQKDKQFRRGYQKRVVNQMKEPILKPDTARSQRYQQLESWILSQMEFQQPDESIQADEIAQADGGEQATGNNNTINNSRRMQATNKNRTIIFPDTFLNRSLNEISRNLVYLEKLQNDLMIQEVKCDTPNTGDRKRRQMNRTITMNSSPVEPRQNIRI